MRATKNRLYFVILSVLVSLFWAPKTEAQEYPIKQEYSFKEEVRQLIQGGFIVLDKDDQVLWLAAGSKWKLASSEGAPSDFAKHMDAFIWQGSRLLFSTEFCHENDYGLKNFIISGHLDLSQLPNRFARPRVILSNSPKSRGEIGCSQIKDLAQYPSTDVSFEYSSHNDQIWLHGFDTIGKPFKIAYQRDEKAERLLQSQWSLISGNVDGAKKCGLFAIRPHGFGPEPFIDAPQFYVDGAGWWPDDPDSPLRVYGCQDKKDRAANEIKNKLKNGYTIDRDNRLIVDPRSDDPLIFQSGGVLSDITGKYKLTGLELKQYNPLFQAAPTEKSVSDRKALKKLGFKLEVKDTQITFSSKCWTMTGDVLRRKSDAILIQSYKIDRKMDCKFSDNPLHRISSKMSTIIDEGAVIKIAFNKTTRELTLTRNIVRQRPRSLNWIFEP